MTSDTYPPLNRRRVLALAGALGTIPTLSGCLQRGNSNGGNGNGGNGNGGNGNGNGGNGNGNGGNGNGGNGNGNGGNGTGNGGVDDEELAELVAENRRFAIELHRELVSMEPGENLFCSPHSISIALAMTYAGARGETEAQMAETLRYTLGEDVHATIEELAERLDARSDVHVDDDEDGDPFQLNVVNAVWGQEEYPFLGEYLDIIEKHYGAGLREVDFKSDPKGSRETINAWVEEQTEEKIDELLPEGSIDQYARLVLTNAIYFMASWEKPFQEGATEGAEFTALDGETNEVPTMRQSESFPYAEVDGHQLIELPYVGEEVGMVVILPEEGEFEGFEAELDGDRLEELVDELEVKEGDISLPRFEYESDFSLKEILEEMGMPIAFDNEQADFSGMADLEASGENLFIHDAYHDAYVAVDEEGTEAAAATGVVVGTDSAPADPFEMVVDRPFLFAIRDRPTGALLFLGRVVDAGAAQ